VLAHHMIKDLKDLLAKNTPYCNELIAAALIEDSHRMDCWMISGKMEYTISFL